MQIEIYSNLEAYVCLSCNTKTTKAIFQTKRKRIFHQNFRKPVSKCVASVHLHCLPTPKRRKLSLNLGDLQWFCLLFSTNERIAVGISLRTAFYLLVVTRVDDEFRFNDASTHEGHLRQNGELTWFCSETSYTSWCRFPSILWRIHSLVLISFNPNKYFIIYMSAKKSNFSIVYF